MYFKNLTDCKINTVCIVFCIIVFFIKYNFILKGCIQLIESDS